MQFREGSCVITENLEWAGELGGWTLVGVLFMRSLNGGGCGGLLSEIRFKRCWGGSSKVAEAMGAGGEGGQMSKHLKHFAESRS